MLDDAAYYNISAIIIIYDSAIDAAGYYTEPVNY
jgi:hypothetical protein